MKLRLQFIPAFFLCAAACQNRETSNTPAATALSPEAAKHTGLSWSPDGKRVAWWEAAGEAGYDNQLWVANADFSSPVKLPVLGLNVPAAWSPDGQRLLVSSTLHGLGQVTVVPLDGGEPRSVSPGPSIKNHLMFHPDGDRVLYVEYSEGGTFRMSVVSLLTGVRTDALPGEKRAAFGAWSPDGKHLAYQLLEGDKYTIWVADGNELHRRQLTTEGFESLAYVPRAAWSPDSKHFLFESHRTGTSDLWVASVDSAEAPRQLTNDVRNDFFGAWSSDGQWVSFTSDRGRQTDIWVVPAAGGSEVRVTDTPAEEATGGVGPAVWRPGTHQLAFVVRVARSGLYTIPSAGGERTALTPDSIRVGSMSISPDGKNVAVAVGHGGGVMDVAVIPVEGGAIRTIVAGGGSAGGVAWSPDGSTIAFTSDRAGVGDVFVVSATGGTPLRVGDFPGYEQAPTWSGDGRWLYFISDRESRLGDAWKVPARGGVPERVTRDGSVGALFTRRGVNELWVGTVSQRSGQLSVQRARPDGALQPIYDKGNVFPGPISPRGDSLALALQQPNGRMQTFLVNSLTGAQGRAIGPAELAVVDWSSDGRTLLTQSRSNGQFDFGLFDLTTGTLRPLTSTPEDELSGVLTPDDKTVVYRVDRTTSRLFTVDLDKVLASAK